MKHLFIKEHNETNSMYVPPAPKDFTGKVIWKFMCRVIWEQINRMCVTPAQRDLGKIGKRGAMKRHTTSCAIISAKKLPLENVKYVAKSSRGTVVWRIIWKFTKMNNDTIALFAHSDLILLPTWDIMKGNNTSQSLFTKINNDTSAHYGHQYLIINPIWDVTKGNNTSLRSLLNMESDSDVPREEKIYRRWKSVFFKFAK